MSKVKLSVASLFKFDSCREVQVRITFAFTSGRRTVVLRKCSAVKLFTSSFLESLSFYFRYVKSMLILFHDVDDITDKR